MPEGPEVKRIGESLAERISLRTLKEINILGGRYQKKLPDRFSEMCSQLPVEIAGPGVHGKFIFIILKNKWSIWNTLGMTGSWSEKREKHSRVEFVLNDGSIFFNDQRNFGTIKFVDESHQLVSKLRSLGPDMLASTLPDSEFIKIMRKYNKKTPPEVLMNQSAIAGVGNYIKAECLYLSKISPHRAISSITDEELINLKTNIHAVMKESFESGGATIRTYKGFNGESGEYGSRFIVYNQKQDPLGNTVIKEKTKDGRTTHWVPDVQK
jgi:formamidopyrimidine-DNA glycosylase